MGSERDTKNEAYLHPQIDSYNSQTNKEGEYEEIIFAFNNVTENHGEIKGN